MRALQIGIAAAACRRSIHIGQARRFGRFALGFVPRRLAQLSLAPQIGGESGELLMAGLPQAAQLEEHKSPESGVRIGEQIAERIQLLLHPYGRALLLLQAIAQQMKFVLEIRVSLFQARTILEELHEPLFLGAHTAPVRTSLEETQLIDQSPASNLKLMRDTKMASTR